MHNNMLVIMNHIYWEMKETGESVILPLVITDFSTLFGFIVFPLNKFRSKHVAEMWLNKLCG